MDKNQLLEKLKNLNSKKDVQELFIDLNFDYSSDDNFNWLGNLISSEKLKEKINSINIINEYKTFNVFYCKLKIENLYRNRRLQRDIAKKIARESDCLIVFTNQDENIFRIVHANVLKSSDTAKISQNHKIQVNSAASLKLSGYTISKDEKLRTASEQLFKIKIDGDIEILDLINNIEKAFRIEPVTEEFFEIIKLYINRLTDDFKSYFADGQKTKAFALQFFNRLLFLKYIEKKKWLNGNIDYLSELVNRYKAHNKAKGSDKGIYKDLLKPLFFFAFSKNDTYIPLNLPEEFINEFKNLPYLNGGLFEENELDNESINIDDGTITGIFDNILNKYNFTVTEGTPFDEEIAIDPEMLGLVYESIVNEEERSGSGIFYTPRIEVDFMCKKSLLHYFSSTTEISNDKLIDLIFSDASESGEAGFISSSFSSDEKKKILSSLYELNVLDPACGSGAFLIGMLQNILDIIIKIDDLDVEELYQSDPGYLYKRKKEFIEKIIHGVDIKPWAVQLAELRLWLYLIWDFETDTNTLVKTPLLPSLDFKIRQGDSLLSEIEGNPIILRNIGEINYLAPDIYSKIHKIIDLKERYYQHSDKIIKREQIKNAEKELIIYILNKKRAALRREFNSLYEREQVAEPQHLFEVTEQQKLDFRLAAEKIKKERKRTEDELDRVNNLIRNIDNIKEKDYFIWEIDFAEIFFAQKNGFDIIIGNPPYVRQEEIAPPLIEKEKVTVDVKRDYKERLINNITGIYGKDKISKFNRKADYYVYFYFVGLSLLKDNGIFTFINSTSWLDVGYGTFLQEFLLKNFRIIDIHDNRVKRSFKRADINTIVISIQRPDSLINLDDNIVKFIMHKVPFEESLNIENINLIYSSNSIINTKELRIYPIKQSELFKEGIEKDDNKILEGKYLGSKWGGKYLRAPDIYFTILEKGKGKLVPLKEVAEVRFGIKTGANDFFYVEPTGKPAPKGLLHVKNGAGWEGFIEEEFLKPVIKSPRECKSITINPKDLEYKVFLCNKSKKELNGTYALKYIEWGEEQDFNNRPSCINRKNWYGLVRQEHAFLSYPMVNNNRLIFALNNGLLNDADLVGVYPKEKYKKYEILFSLNATYNMLNMELAGISNLGEGAIKQNPIYIKNFSLIIDPELIKLDKNFNTILKRNIKSIFTECGFSLNKPIRIQKPKPLHDRGMLDDIIFNILNLTENERKEVYWSVCELVQNRLQKAKSIYK